MAQAAQTYQTNITDESGTVRLEGQTIFTDTGPLRVIGPYNIAFNTPSLDAGVTIFTPAAGEYIIGAVFVVTTPWNGTTPLGDVGDTVNYAAYGTGFYKHGTYKTSLTTTSGTAFDMTAALSGFALGANAGSLWISNPIKVWVSQDGTPGGTATGATAGAASVYLIDPCVSRLG